MYVSPEAAAAVKKRFRVYANEPNVKLIKRILQKIQTPPTNGGWTLNLFKKTSNYSHSVAPQISHFHHLPPHNTQITNFNSTSQISSFQINSRKLYFTQKSFSYILIINRIYILIPILYFYLRI